MTSRPIGIDSDKILGHSEKELSSEWIYILTVGIDTKLNKFNVIPISIVTRSLKGDIPATLRIEPNMIARAVLAQSTSNALISIPVRSAKKCITKNWTLLYSATLFLWTLFIKLAETEILCFAPFSESDVTNKLDQLKIVFIAATIIDRGRWTPKSSQVGCQCYRRGILVHSLSSQII